MSRQMPNVRTWSKTVPSYLFDVADLDVYVLEEHPEIVAAMGRRRRADRRELWDLAVVVLLVLTPLAAVFAGGGRLPSGAESDGLAGSSAVDLAGYCFAVTVLGLLLVGWWWWRRDRHWDPVETVGVAVSFVAGRATRFGRYVGVTGPPDTDRVDDRAVAEVGFLPLGWSTTLAGARGRPRGS